MARFTIALAALVASAAAAEVFVKYDGQIAEGRGLFSKVSVLYLTGLGMRHRRLVFRRGGASFVHLC